MVIQFQVENGIVRLTFDRADRSSNLLDDRFQSVFEEVLDRLESLAGLVGVLLLSSKKDFLAGADLQSLYEMNGAEPIMAMVERFKSTLRRLEKLPCPVVALINGTTLGGGYELVLACHHRVAVGRSDIRIGLPEVKFGLFPGGGGTQRLPRLLGIQKALPILLEGKDFSPQQALTEGLVDHLVADESELLAYGLQWIANHPHVRQPWDRPDFRWPGGDARDPQLMGFWAVAPSALRRKTRAHYPAPEAALSCVYEGALTDIDTGLRIESRRFAAIAAGKTAKNMITSFWFNLNQIKKGESRPRVPASRPVGKVGILGAGMMGAGIAFACAKAGILVVLKDKSKTLAEKGKDQSREWTAQRVAKGTLSPRDAERLLAGIYTTDHLADLRDCDLVIEAVFEDRNLKNQVYREVETRLNPDTVMATNTSTLPISSLAEAVRRPGNFIGLHFFSPVDRMQLVEIIVGERTSEETLAKAFDFVGQIGKVPIVVNDRRGFYTSRVFCTYVFEGLAMLLEGQRPSAIEAAGLEAGMPVGPLALCDEISISLMDHILSQTRADFEREGRSYEPHPAESVVKRMVELGRVGRKVGAGFYDYEGPREKSLWQGLKLHFHRQEPLSQEDMVTRLLFIQVLETTRCFEEDVVTKVADANIGSILGWGFPPFKGGTLQFLNDYGIAAFNERCKSLQACYGGRFHPPELLFRMAEEHARFA